MNRSLLSAFLAVFGAVSAYCDITVPAFTAYIEPDPGAASVSAANGITGWKDSAEKVVWAGSFPAAGQVKCAVSLRLPAGAVSRLRLTVGSQRHEAQATGVQGALATVDFGAFDIAAAGYQRFVLESLNSPGTPFGDLDSLTISGPAAEGAHFNLKPRRNAASVHLAYPEPPGEKIAAMYCEATGVETPIWTYIMVCGWNRGYLGMQVNSPTERRIIFSVWDGGQGQMKRADVADVNRTTLIAKGEGVYTGDFGNEGTGGHSHLVYPWKTGEKQRFLLTARPVDATHTVYSGYYFHPEKKQWMLIATWKAPQTGDWLAGLYSFSENFGGGNGELRRKALYGNQWIMSSEGKWSEITKASFSHDDTGVADRLDRFMGVENGQFFLSNGGFIPGTMPFGQKFERPANGTPPADVVQLVSRAFASPAQPPPVAEPASLIPKPAQVEWKQGAFRLNLQSGLFGSSNEAATEAVMLAGYLRPATGFALPVRKAAQPGGEPNGIALDLDPSLASTVGGEGYQLDVTPAGVRISAAGTAGLFYGGQTLRELLPPAIFARSPQPSVAWNIPCCHIVDKPRFIWRAYMLDYSRHFLDETYTKHLLDVMALHKLNVYHMHLSDDDGWRVEIKKYPKLTEVGGWRGTACPLPNTREGEKFERYGGFFTQDQIREIVAYAAQRHIQIMPEIDLPGHSRALCTAYPEVLPVQANGKRDKDGNTVSPGSDANYRMVDGIVSELAELFPFEYIHIGGDEVGTGSWSNSPEIKSLIQREHLGGVGDVQHYFTKRLEGILAAHGRKMVGWNEITNDKLARTTAIMAWSNVGSGYNAARMGFPTILAPAQNTYFDMPYPKDNDEPPALYWAGPTDCARCYSLDPLGDKNLKPDQIAHILGVAGCLWTEKVTPWTSKAGWADFKTVGEAADYKTLPRLCALAEVAWTPQERRDYEDFNNRLGNGHLDRLAYAGYIFRVTPPDAVVQADGIHIVPATPGGEIRYTTDGTDPFNSSTAQVWKGQPIQCKPDQLRARAYVQGHPGPLHVGAHS